MLASLINGNGGTNKIGGRGREGGREKADMINRLFVGSSEECV